jgi:hypothetical protein
MRHAALALGILLGACTSGPPVTLTGQWGGVNAELDAASTSATLLFKCGAKGVTAAPLRLDARGSFDASGTYDPVLLAGGPRPARFLGQVQGTRLTLSFTVEGSTANQGPYELTKDAPARFDVCNF